MNITYLDLWLSFRGVAQLVEQRSPKPRVVSSSLATPATINVPEKHSESGTHGTSQGVNVSSSLATPAIELIF